MTDQDIALGEPRATAELMGHEAAEETLLEAVAADRLHHAWLITGPKGIGKATLAYRFARHLLAYPPAARGASLFGDLPSAPPHSLYLSPDHPVFRQVAAEAHPDLMTVKRGLTDEGRLRGEIVIEEVRALVEFFAKTSGAGGWRIAIVDSVDELNRNAANALLKVLEEPPARAILLLISHAPGRVLATIRSRCRRLPLRPLSTAEIDLFLAAHGSDIDDHGRQVVAALTDGSPGTALRLAREGGLDLYHRLIGILAGLPTLDAKTALSLADELGGRGAEDKFRLFGFLLGGILGRVACVAGGGLPGLTVPGEEETLRRLAAECGLDPWAELWEKSTALIERADAIKLDRRQVAVALLYDLARTVRP